MASPESNAESATATTPLLSTPPSTYQSRIQPLLPSDHRLIHSLKTTPAHIARLLPDRPSVPFSSGSFSLHTTRHQLQTFLSSKYGHYSVLALVSLDVAGIFADFLISLHLCEHGGEKGFNPKPWERADEGLEVASLVFSSLFLAELIACVFAFGWRCVFRLPLNLVRLGFKGGDGGLLRRCRRAGEGGLAWIS